MFVFVELLTYLELIQVRLGSVIKGASVGIAAADFFTGWM